MHDPIVLPAATGGRCWGAPAARRGPRPHRRPGPPPCRPAAPRQTPGSPPPGLPSPRLRKAPRLSGQCAGPNRQSSALGSLQHGLSFERNRRAVQLAALHNVSRARQLGLSEASNAWHEADRSRAPRLCLNHVTLAAHACDRPTPDAPATPVPASGGAAAGAAAAAGAPGCAASDAPGAASPRSVPLIGPAPSPGSAATPPPSPAAQRSRPSGRAGLVLGGRPLPRHLQHTPQPSLLIPTLGRQGTCRRRPPPLQAQAPAAAPSALYPEHAP